MDPSTVPAAKAALLTALRARPGLSGVQIEWSHPGKGKAKNELIYLGDTEPDQEASRLGNRRRMERYDLEVIVSVFDRADDAEVIERRCWELLAEVFTELRDNSTLTDTVDVAQIASSPVRNFNGASGRVSEAECHVQIVAEV